MAIPNVSDWYIQDLDSHTLQTIKLSTTKKKRKEKKRIECSWVISVLASQVVVIIIIFGW